MRIGIDLDDTLTKTNEIFSKYLKKYRRLHHLNRFSKELQLSMEEWTKFLEEYGEVIYREVKEKPGALSVLKKWRKEGHEIYIITARSEIDCPHMEEYTRSYLEVKGIDYQEIVFGSKNKYQDAKSFRLDVFIDDRESVLDAFPPKDFYLIRMVKSKNEYSKYHKVTSWKEIDQLVDKL